MKKLLLGFAALMLIAMTGMAQKVTTRAVDNKGTIRWVIDSSTAVITKGDSTILYVTPSQLMDSINSSQDSAYNGLTKVGDSIKLGGTLNQVTTIATSATNFLQITGLQQGSNATDSLVVINPTTGQLKIISASSLLSSLTAKNGLTKTNDTVELGGALTKPTTITTDATNTLSLPGLQGGNLSTDSIVVTDATTGTLKRVSASSLLQSGVTTHTATFGQTAYAVPNMPADASRVWVFRNGAKLVSGTDYTAAAASVTLVPNPTPPNDWSVVAGDIIEVQWVK